jgi:hypothetical protein
MDFPWLEILKNFGPLASILVFFVYRDWQRELKLTKRLEKLEDYQKQMLQNLVERTTAALVQSSECLKWIGHIVERLTNICPKIYGQECDNNDSNQS